jgi:hypothetical protein
MAKMYNILKSSYYKETGQSFMDNLLYGTVTTEDTLKNMVLHALEKDDVKSVEYADDDTDNLIYVTYNAEYEKKFKHGFKVQEIDSDKGSVRFITKQDTEWIDWIKNTVNSHTKEE